MTEVLQLRCELEQLAIIREVMFGAIIVMTVEVALILSYKIRAKS
jgi:hypothetical protein